MLAKLARLHGRNRDIIAVASDILKRDLADHYREDNPVAFERNRDIQVGVFIANHLFLQILTDTEVRAKLSLGLSLGEYNHLVHIGALNFPEALRLVEARGQAYDRGPRGAMASIFPIELEELEAVAERARDKGVLEVVNFNSPGQHVLSGETAALEKALGILEEEFYCQGVIIERQVPMHSSIFRPVGEAFRKVLQAASFSAPALPYFPNRLGRPIDAPSREQFVDLLSEHVYSPVLWRRSIDYIVERSPDAVFVEVGPLSRLSNLLDRKWHRNRKYFTDSGEDTGDHLRQVIDELREPRAAAGK